VQSVEKASKNRNAGPIDFSLFTDGLRAEREQGITIDVAYRYFATARRKFILADTPGHEQYTRNMATGASTADVAILLVDARNGVRASRAARPHRALLGITRLRRSPSTRWTSSTSTATSSRTSATSSRRCSPARGARRFR
jgi:sulfate adenylyltransferase subunit 1 (EFTu-like GTPase family)